MTLKQGGNLNTDSEATVTTVAINDTTATIISAANSLRTPFVVNLNGGTADEEVFIRLYPAATDNIKKGIVLKRKIIGATSINDAIFVLENNAMYTGEISALSESGTFDVHVTEF